MRFILFVVCEVGKGYLKVWLRRNFAALFFQVAFVRDYLRLSLLTAAAVVVVHHFGALKDVDAGGAGVG